MQPVVQCSYALTSPERSGSGLVYPLILVVLLGLPMFAYGQVDYRAEAYQVYSSILAQTADEMSEDFGAWGRRFALGDSTTLRGFAFYEPHTPPAHRHDDLLAVPIADSAWIDFVRKQVIPAVDTLRKFALEEDRFIRKGYRFVPFPKVEIPERYHKRSPQYVSFSPVIFSADYQKAFVYVDFLDSGYNSYLEKQNGKWREVAQNHHWVE